MSITVCTTRPLQVRDERSYETGNMRKAIRVLSGGAPPNLPSSSLATFEALCRRCIEAQGEMVDEEEELGDIPDELLDEITSEIMIDPVRLPSGKVTRHCMPTVHVQARWTAHASLCTYIAHARWSTARRSRATCSRTRPTRSAGRS